MDIRITEETLKKLLEKHQVQLSEVEQTFYNRNGDYFEDQREDHQTTPPTEWFLARTHKNRLLKVCCVFYQDSGAISIKTAYEPNETEIDLYLSLTQLQFDDL